MFKKLFGFFILFIAINLSIKAQTIITFAGNGGYGNTGDGGPATAATLKSVNCVIADDTGAIFIISDNVIRKVDTAGIITTFAGTGTAGFSGDGGAATAAKFNYPTGLATDHLGNIYVADNGNQRIRKITASGIVTTVAGTGANGYTGDGGAATAATFSYPYGVIFDLTGNMYISDMNNHVIRMVNTSGIINTIIGSGVMGSSGDGGTPLAAQLDSPAGMHIDRSGQLLFADHGNAKIRMCGADGRIHLLAGWYTSGYSGEYVAATSGLISNLWDVTMDITNDNIYFPDAGNNRVRRVYTYASWLITVAGDGIAGNTGDGGAAASARVSYTTSAAVDAHNNLFIADRDNFKIREIPCPGGAPVMAPITGDSVVCQGATMSLHNSTYTSFTYSSYAYSSSNPGVASVSSSTGGIGIVSGISGGTATITYTQSSPCGSNYITKNITVNPLPIIPPIIGSTMACASTTFTFSDSLTGGVWTSATGLATVGSSTGIVNAVAPGTATISYTVTNGCGSTFVTQTIIISAVAPTVTSISGVGSVCVGTGTTFTDGSSGGVWLSSNNSVAFAGSTGLITGVSPGSTVIEYLKVNGCGRDSAIQTVTVPYQYTTDDIITTVAGTGIAGYSGDGGMGYDATLQVAQGIARDRWGNIYFSDVNNRYIRKLNQAGIISTLTGIDFYPAGVAVDTFGNIYVADISTVPLINEILKITPDGSWSVFVPNTSSLSNINGLGMDRSNNLYIANGGLNEIMKVTPAGIMTVFAGNTTGAYTGDGGAATAATLNNPQGVKVDAAGNVYIADYGNYVVRKVNTSGIISTVAGSIPYVGWGGDGGPATSATLGNVYDVALDTVGNLYISDNSHAIRMVNLATGIISTRAGIGSSSADGVPATTASMQNTFLTTDGSGNIYFSDAYNNKVRKVSIGNMGTITGNDSVCVAHTIVIGDTLGGGTGTWTSSDATIATIGSTGIVTGVATGTVTVSYGLSNACSSGYATKTITVNGLPAVSAILGATSVNVGSTITLSDTLAGGTWSSSSTATATIGSTGVVTGIASGTDTISYTVSNSCGNTIVTYPITVIPALNINGIATKNEDIKLYPNPATSKFVVEATTAGTLTIFTYDGKIIEQYPISKNYNHLILPKNCAAGIYLVRFKSENGFSKLLNLVVGN